MGYIMHELLNTFVANQRFAETGYSALKSGSKDLCWLWHSVSFG